jgi:hypothetical protein
MKVLKVFFYLFLFSSIGICDVIYTSVGKIAKNSSDIIEGRVVNVEQKWDGNHKFIFTYTTIKIKNIKKGAIKSKEIIVKEIGGKLDGFTTYADCQPNYSINEDVMVFLQRNGDFYQTYGLNQGKFNIINNNGKKMLKRDIDINKLTILEKNVSRETIKSSFDYNDFIKNINLSK